MMKKKIFTLLHRSAKTGLSDGEQRKTEDARVVSERPFREGKKNSHMETAVSESAIRSFKPFFAERVMHQIEALERMPDLSETFYQSLIAVARPVFTGIGISVMGLIFYNILNGGHVSISSVFVMNDVTFEDVFIPTFSLFL